MAPRSSPPSRSASAFACSRPSSVRSRPGTAVSSRRATLAWVWPWRTRKSRTSETLDRDAAEALDPGLGTGPEVTDGDGGAGAGGELDVDLLAGDLRAVGELHDEGGHREGVLVGVGVRQRAREAPGLAGGLARRATEARRRV